MNKFKNKLAVRGSIHHLNALVEDLKKIGYAAHSITGDPHWLTKPTHLITNYEGGEYGFHNHSGNKQNITLTLPQDWQKALELAAEVEEIKPEFKNGDWVFVKRWHFNADLQPQIGQYNQYNQVPPNHGIDLFKTQPRYHGVWWFKEEDFRHATKEEIEAHLIKEAENKGFVPGAICRSKEFGTLRSPIKELFFDKILCVRFKDGGWDRINDIEPIAHPTITINGYDAKFESWGLNFNNCAKINKEAFIEAQDFITKVGGMSMSNRTVTSIKIGKGEFTPQQIEEIVKYYQDKEAK
jgi:hypothetical protein